MRGDFKEQARTNTEEEVSGNEERWLPERPANNPAQPGPKVASSASAAGYKYKLNRCLGRPKFRIRILLYCSEASTFGLITAIAISSLKRTKRLSGGGIIKVLGKCVSNAMMYACMHAVMRTK